MTLREKFKERLYNQSHDDSECLRIKFENIDKVIDSQEVIADEFAIGFGEWICEKAEVPYIKGKMDSTLEIYKKEREV
jgi:hypothetical protein